MRTVVISEYDAATSQVVSQIGEKHDHATFAVFRSIADFKAQKTSPFDYDLAVISGFNGDGERLAMELSDRRPQLPVIGLNDICHNTTHFHDILTRNFTSIAAPPCHLTPIRSIHFGALPEVVKAARRTASRTATRNTSQLQKT